MISYKNYLKKIKSALKNQEESLSLHSSTSFSLGLISIISFFGIGSFYLYNYNKINFQNLFLAFLEGMFALIGLFFTDLIRKRRSNSNKNIKYFKKISNITVGTSFFLLLIISFFYFLFKGLILLSVDIDYIIFTIFAATSEELFFRGFLLTYFRKIDLQLNRKLNINDYSLSYIAIIGILFSSILFSILHINYYDDNQMMLILFLSGIIFGFAFWITDDITSCIIAHTTINLASIVRAILVGF